MSRRGSAQLLLLFFRSRSRRRWALGAIGGVVAVAGLIQAGGDFPLLTRTGLAQVIRQSIWQHALAGMPEQAPWPWAVTPTATDPTVPRLGLSAAVGQDKDPSEDGNTVIEPQQPRTKLSEVGVGDHITVTKADGSSRIYRITGRRVVDPHLAETDFRGAGHRSDAGHLPAARPGPGQFAEAGDPGDDGRSTGAAGTKTPTETLGRGRLCQLYCRFFFFFGGAGVASTAGAASGWAPAVAAVAPA